jgi:hypothetical protein
VDPDGAALHARTTIALTALHLETKNERNTTILITEEREGKSLNGWVGFVWWWWWQWGVVVTELKCNNLSYALSPQPQIHAPHDHHPRPLTKTTKRPRFIF